MRRPKAKEARLLDKSIPAMAGRLRTKPIRLQMRLTTGESELLDSLCEFATGSDAAGGRSGLLVGLLRAEGKRQGFPVPKTDNELHRAGRLRACIKCDASAAEVVVDSLAGEVRPLCRACFEAEQQ